MASKSTQQVVRVKPMEPTQLWTFKGVLDLLDGPSAEHISNGIDDFLLQNRKVFLDPLPFVQNGEKPVPEGATEFMLRKTLYTDVSAEDQADCKEIALTLGVDSTEVLRCVVQTCKRSPPRALEELSIIKSKLPDDRAIRLKEERLELYSGRILEEKRSVLRIVAKILKLRLQETPNGSVSSLVVRNLAKEIVLSQTYVDLLLKAVEKTYDTLVSWSPNKNSHPSWASHFFDETVFFMIDLLKVVSLIFQLVVTAPENVQYWFELMGKSNFFLNLGPILNDNEVLLLVQGFGTMASLIALNLYEGYGELLSENQYMNSPNVMKNINLAIKSVENANPVVSYTWLLILNKKSLIIESFSGEKEVSSFEASFSKAEIAQDIAYFSKECSKSNVFQDLSLLHKHFKAEPLCTATLTSIIIASFPYINLTREITIHVYEVLKDASPRQIEEFFNNEYVQKNLILCRAKFPLTLSPFLNIASVNGGFAYNEIKDMKSYMTPFSRREIDSITETDDETTELVHITKFLDIYPPYEINNKLSLLLSAKTKAKVLPSAVEGEVLVAFLYEFNGWAFLGRILQNVARSFNSADLEKTAVIVDILTAITEAIKKLEPAEVSQLLSTISIYIDDSDILEIVFRLFEQGLHTRNIVVLCASVKLINSLVKVVPNRIWIFFTTSALFECHGHEDFASVIFGAIEMVNGDFLFSLELIRLAESLTKQSLIGAEPEVARNKKQVIYKFTSHLMKVFESFIHCHFKDSKDKCIVGRSILSIFSLILIPVYGIDQDSKLDDKITSVLAPSAHLILESFASSGTGTRVITPLAVTLDGNHKYEYLNFTGDFFNQWLDSVLDFSLLIINIRSLIDHEPTRLELVLYGKLPALTTLYASGGSHRVHILNLLSALVTAKWKEEEAPSILSHLKPDFSKILTSSIAADLENPFDSDQLKVSLYKFIGAVMGSKHKGLSMLFIEGSRVLSTSRQRKSEASPTSKNQTVLRILKRNVKDMKYYPDYVSIHLVDAISIALNAWIIESDYREEDSRFVAILLERFRAPYNVQVSSNNDYSRKCHEIQLLVKITKVFSILMFALQDESSIKPLLDLMDDAEFRLELLKRCDVFGFNKSLLESVQDECESKLGVSIDKFAKSALNSREVDQSFYDFSIMKSMYKDNEQWNDIEDLIKAFNYNEIWTSAQIEVVKYHSALISAFCARYPSRLTAEWVNVSSQLLFYNVIVDVPYEILPQVHIERSENAFFVLNTIAKNKSLKLKSEEVIDVIKFVSELIHSRHVDFINLITSGGHGIYKLLLRILRIAFDLIKEDTSNLVQNSSILIEIFDLVIAKATRNLFVKLQNEVYLMRTDKHYKAANMEEQFENLTHVMSILKVFVQFNCPRSFHEDMARIVSNHGTVKSLLNLYKNSHLLTVNGELLFAELSVVLILEFLIIDAIAQEFIDSGLYMVLAGSMVSGPIRNGTTSLRKSEQHYHLWVYGLLPLAVSTFQRVGDDVPPEIVLFLETFHKQIEACFSTWGGDHRQVQISTALVLETRQLLEIHLFILKLQLKAGSSWFANSQIPAELLLGLESDNARADFVEKVKNLLKHPKYLSLRLVPSLAEEKRLFESELKHAIFSAGLTTEIRELVELLQEE